MREAILKILNEARDQLVSGEDGDDWAIVVYEKLEPFLIHEERRALPERREKGVQIIELESGKAIWYTEDEESTGFERRSGIDRRRDTT